MKSLYKTVLGRRVIRDVTSGTATSSQGQQAALAFFALGATELESMRDAVAGAATSNDVKFLLGHAKMNLILRNQSNSHGKMVLYDCYLTEHPHGSAVDQPIELWSKGMTDMGLTNQHLEVGTTPFLSPEFRKNVRVFRVTSQILEPGQEHHHQVIRRYNRTVSSTEFDSRGGVFYFRNLTLFTLAVWHGSLGHESTAPTKVSFMPLKIDWVQSKDVHFGGLPQSVPTYTYAKDLQNITDFDFMGENQDADLNDVVA